MSFFNYPIKPLATDFYSYTNEKPIKFTIIPNLIFQGLVFDSSKEKGEEVYETGVVLEEVGQPLFEGGERSRMEITIPKNTRVMDRQNIIRKQLRDIVIQAIHKTTRIQDGGGGKDIGKELYLPNNPNSPPIYILPLNQQGGRTLRQLVGNHSWFEIIKINDTNYNGFGKERVFKQAPPELVMDNTRYFEPNDQDLLSLTAQGGDKETASCAFQYIYQKFGKKKGYIKKARDFQKIKHYATHAPPQFAEWIKGYNTDIQVDKLKLNTQENIDFDLEPFTDELFGVKIIDLGEQSWTQEEEYNSLSVLEIITWCMNSATDCYVIDYDGSYYMNYIHNKFVKNKADKPQKNRLTIVVKVFGNHAYFVEDSNIKKSVVHTHKKWYSEEFKSNKKTSKKAKQKYEDLKNGLKADDFEEVEKRFEKLHTEGYDEEEIEKIKQDLKAEIKQERIDKITKKDTDKIWYYPEVCGEVDEYGEYIKQKHKDKPPLTPQELIDDSNRIVYLNVSSLNGLVEFIYRNYDKRPSSMIGQGIRTIDKVCYKSNTIFSNKHYPYGDKPAPSHEVLNKLITDFPFLPFDRLPTPTQIGDAIFEDKVGRKRDIFSHYNSNTERVFMDAEIKADNRVVENTDIDRDFTFSIDLEKAYTNALLKNDCEWSVIDSIDQFENYDGIFNPNRYYLVEQLKNEYPLRDIDNNKLVLYHGCFLRHLLGKGLVIIKYVLNPNKVLEADYFKPFAEIVIQYSKDKAKLDGQITYKSIINNFIGNLKKVSKIVNYKHYIEEDKGTAERLFYNGSIPLDFNKYRGKGEQQLQELKLISNCKEAHYIESANPIRLQVIDKINEALLFINSAYKSALTLNKYLFDFINSLKNRKKRTKILGKKKTITKSRKNTWDLIPRIAMTRTDAIYYIIPFTNKSKTSKITEEVKFKKIIRDRTLQESYGDIVLNKFNLFVDIMIRIVKSKGWICKLEKGIPKSLWNFVSNKPQLSINLNNNSWKEVIEIDKYWTKDSGANFILNILLNNGGGLVEGCGGVGKTELLKKAKDRMRKNRAKYLLLKEIYKYHINQFEILENFRNKNPCFYRTLAPTNKACNLIGGDTLNRGLGIPVIEKGEEVAEGAEHTFQGRINYLEGGKRDKKNGNLKPTCDVIIIDEISMINGKAWSYLQYIKRRIPRIKFIICGDIERQLPPVLEEDRDFYNAYVIKEISQFLKIKLNYNFRNGDNGDKIWNELLEEKIHTIPITPDYKENTLRNICWLNKTRRRVIEYRQNQLENPLVLNWRNFDNEKPQYIKENCGGTEDLKIEVDTPLISYRGNKEINVFNNEIYIVKEIDLEKEIVKLKSDIVEDKDLLELSYKDLYKSFCSAYCITIHKAQGDTYRDKYTIWDFKKVMNKYQEDKFEGKNKYAKKLMYVGISRSTDYENNIIYKS